MAVKYYSDDWPTNIAKLAFEKSLFAKTLKTNARVEGMPPKYHPSNIHMRCINSDLVIVRDD